MKTDKFIAMTCLALVLFVVASPTKGFTFEFGILLSDTVSRPTEGFTPIHSKKGADGTPVRHCHFIRNEACHARCRQQFCTPLQECKEKCADICDPSAIEECHKK